MPVTGYAAADVWAAQHRSAGAVPTRPETGCNPAGRVAEGLPASWVSGRVDAEDQHVDSDGRLLADCPKSADVV